MFVYGNDSSGFDCLVKLAEEQKQPVGSHSYDKASDEIDRNPLAAPDAERLDALRQSMPVHEVIISWPRLTGRAKALADMVFTCIASEASTTITEIAKPRKKTFDSYDAAPVTYFDPSQCARGIIRAGTKRREDAAEHEVLLMNLRSIGAPTTAAAKKRLERNAPLSLDFVYAYGGYRKPVFPVTEQEHHNSFKQLVRAADKAKGSK